MRVTRDKAVDALKPMAPATVRVFTAAGEQTDLGLPVKSRTKWHRFKQTLEAFDWVRLEARDAKGNVVGVLENSDAAADDLAVLDGGGEMPITERAGEQAQLLRLMLAAQDVALRRHTEHTRETLDAATELLRVYVQRIVALEGSVHQLLDRLAYAQTAGAAQQPVTGEELLLDALVARGGPNLGRGELKKLLREVAPDIIREAMKAPPPGAPAPTPPTAPAPPKNGH